MTRYIKGKDGKLAGSRPDPAAAPTPSDVPPAPAANTPSQDRGSFERAYAAFQNAPTVTRIEPDPLRSANRAPIRPSSPKDEERRDQTVAWARDVPEDDRATDAYLAMIAKELDITPADARFRFDLLRDGTATGVDFVDNADTDGARFVTVLPSDGEGAASAAVGTPRDPATVRAMAQMETLAADARRDKRAQVEVVDEDGVRWVRYENEELSEVLRGVQYNEQTGECSVLLRTRLDTPDTPDVVQYTYSDVDPSIVRQLVSARSMGRFFSYTLGRLPSGGSMKDPWTGESVTVRDYAFITHYSNFLWPTRRAGGPMPTARALDAARQDAIR